MPADTFTDYVFVDFENVPKVDLELIEGKPVHVTLLIGKNQGKLDVDLAVQGNRLSRQVAFESLSASGHNALDLILACCLGQVIQRCPGARFYIVSKDKGFEPMIAHLAGKGIRVHRCDSLAALPFLPEPTKPNPIKAAVPAKSNPPFRAVLPVKAGAQEARLEKLAARLQDSLSPRPRTKSRLLAHINTAYGVRLSEAEQNEKLAELIRRGVLTIDANGKVSYTSVTQA